MTVSLIIATHDRDYLLERFLGRLHFLTLPDEIIVIDDGGLDDTDLVCLEHGKIRYIYNRNPGWSNRCLASNIGLRLATSDEILYADAETEFLSDVVEQLTSARKSRPHDVLHVKTSLKERSPYGPCDETPSGVGLYRREWLEEIGGWDESLPAPTGYDDADLHTRLSFVGHPCSPVDGTFVRHLWHPVHPWNKEGQHVKNPNLTVLEAKTFPQDLVANKGTEWGRPL